MTDVGRICQISDPDRAFRVAQLLRLPRAVTIVSIPIYSLVLPFLACATPTSAGK